MAIRSKEHYKALNEIITFKGTWLGRTYSHNKYSKKLLRELYRKELDHYYDKVMYISRDCRQWLIAASKFKAAGDMVGYASCMENYKHYNDRKIQLTNKKLF